MAENFVNVTEGAGKKLHTFNRTIGANDVHDEVTIAGIPYLATYVFAFSAPAMTTAASHLLQVMAGASLNLYIVKVEVFQMAAATTAAFCELRLVRLSTAGTGGTAQTARALDTTDAAAGATGMTLPTAKGTEGNVVHIESAYLTQTPGAAGTNWGPIFRYENDRGIAKPIRIPAGATNGIAITNVQGIAGATCTGTVTFVEANF